MRSQVFADTLHRDIQNAYASLNDSHGWRLLYGPATGLDAAEVAFIGLNPGGTEAACEFDQPLGSAYVVESWAGRAVGESPLQRQVRALFSYLDQEPHEVLAGNLVPFRSPSWRDLPDKARAISFGADLWKRILERTRPKLVICMGRVTYDSLSGILSARSAKTINVNWGTVAARRASYEGGEIVGLPHLSRFGIMTRAESRSGLARVFSGVI